MPDRGRKKLYKTTVSLPHEVATDMKSWAEEEGRTPSNLMAYLLELAVRRKYPEKYPPKNGEYPES